MKALIAFVLVLLAVLLIFTSCNQDTNATTQSELFSGTVVSKNYYPNVYSYAAYHITISGMLDGKEATREFIVDASLFVDTEIGDKLDFE